MKGRGTTMEKRIDPRTVAGYIADTHRVFGRWSAMRDLWEWIASAMKNPDRFMEWR